jgi:hypothetical protein
VKEALFSHTCLDIWQSRSICVGDSHRFLLVLDVKGGIGNATIHEFSCRDLEIAMSCEGQSIGNKLRITSTFTSYAELAIVLDFDITGQLLSLLDTNGLGRDWYWRSNIRPQVG